MARREGIAQLLVVTTLIAFALAAPRWALSDRHGDMPWLMLLLQLGIALLWISGVGPLCVWSVLRVRVLAISAAITAFHAVLLTAAVILIVYILSQGNPGSGFIPFTICFHAAAFAVLWSGLAIMRWLGYRLGSGQVRSDRPDWEKRPPAQPMTHGLRVGSEESFGD